MAGPAAVVHAQIGPRFRDLAVITAVGGGAVVALAVVALRAWNGGLEPEGRNWWIAAALIVGVVDVGLGTQVARSRRGLGASLFAVGAGLLVSGLATGYGARAATYPNGLPGAGLIAALQAPAALVAIGVLSAVVPLFLPAGRLRRPLGPLALGAATLGLVAIVAASITRPPPWTPAAPANPLLVDGRVREVLDAVGQGGRWVLVTVASMALASVLQDWWTTRPARDPLQGWLAAGAVAAWLGAAPALVPGVEDRLPGASVALPLLLVATIPLLSVALLVAATRDAAWEAGMASHRFLEWLLLATSITLTYTVAVAGLGRLVGGSGPTWLLVGATGVVALLLEPVRDHIRRLVDHVLYGDRSDPLALVREVMRNVTSVADVDQLLPTLALTVGTALRIEHVRIDVVGPPGWARSGVYGRITPHSLTLPLVHQSERVGQLVIGWSSGSSLRRRDRAVLDDLVTHLAQVVSWVRLTLDLRRSSLAVTSAREEERRRLRRDLHDGLGPSLTGISLGLRTGLRQLGSGEPAPQARALALMANLADEVDRTVDEVKRIVRDLRPTALDERDLPSAIVDLARRMAPAVRVHLDLPATPIALPAAIEVATYRITSEALTNVVRHASATQCWVRLRVDGAVALEVVDDGVGLAPVPAPGVGLVAMSERVTELGGTLAVSNHEPHGTRLAVRLPAVLR